MESVVLQARYIDVVKTTIKHAILPSCIGAAFAIFNNENQLHLLLVCISAFLAIVMFCSLIVAYSPPATLVKDGIVYKDWRGRDGVFSPWENEIAIDCRYVKLTGNYIIKDISKNKTIHVISSVFMYPEIRNFINNHCPSNHALKKIIADTP